jgi:hypothetical protein
VNRSLGRCRWISGEVERYDIRKTSEPIWIGKTLSMGRCWTGGDAGWPLGPLLEDTEGPGSKAIAGRIQGGKPVYEFRIQA